MARLNQESGQWIENDDWLTSSVRAAKDQNRGINRRQILLQIGDQSCIIRQGLRGAQKSKRTRITISHIFISPKRNRFPVKPMLQHKQSVTIISSQRTRKEIRAKLNWNWMVYLDENDERTEMWSGLEKKTGVVSKPFDITFVAGVNEDGSILGGAAPKGVVN